jgi:hypothetical protein
MIEKFTKQLIDKLYIEIQKKENQKKLNEMIKIILETIELDLKINLPQTTSLKINTTIPTLIYNSYN